MSNLEEKMERLCDKIDTLIDQNKKIIFPLMIVVCVIALGRAGLEMARDIMGPSASAQVEEVSRAGN